MKGEVSREEERVRKGKQRGAGKSERKRLACEEEETRRVKKITNSGNNESFCMIN